MPHQKAARRVATFCCLWSSLLHACYAIRVMIYITAADSALFSFLHQVCVRSGIKVRKVITQIENGVCFVLFSSVDFLFTFIFQSAVCCWNYFYGEIIENWAIYAMLVIQVVASADRSTKYILAHLWRVNSFDNECYLRTKHIRKWQ